MRSSKGSIGAWLSLFAMLMIFLGPLVSQGMSLSHGMNDAMTMGEMPCHDSMPSMAQASEPAKISPPHSLVVWEKCGYCSLLFQHPALPPSTFTVVRSGYPPALFRVSCVAPQAAMPPVFPGARTRAPPALC